MFERNTIACLEMVSLLFLELFRNQYYSNVLWVQINRFFAYSYETYRYTNGQSHCIFGPPDK